MFIATILIIIFFVLSLGLKKIFTKICAICFAVSGTWLVGLAIGLDLVILALLMGGTAVGLMYYLASALPEKFEFFKLPFLLSVFIVFYSILSRTLDILIILEVVVTWLLFGLIFLSRNGRTKNWFKIVVECCKNW
ncbi:MAG: hypothetical protein AAB586_01610 [Patescibacteria group bacterium]